MPCAPSAWRFDRALHGAPEMMRFSSCCAIESAISCASTSGWDLLDVHMHLVDAHQPAQFGLERFDLLALLADHHAGRAEKMVMRASFAGPLDQHAADRGVRELALRSRAP